MARSNGTNKARVIQVIETKADKGMGVGKDPVREVTQYWDLDGNFLAEMDPDPQYLSELSIWESKRLSRIIEDWKETRKPQSS